MIWMALGLSAGFYMAWGIGANDVANSMGTSVGSKALTVKKAALIAGILNVLGAVFLGSQVTNTISKRIVDPKLITDPNLIVIGALSALIAAALWLTLSTYFHLPVSTTHSIVGSMTGFGIISVGFSRVNWWVLMKIVGSWIISPILGGILGFIIFRFISRKILEKDDTVACTVKYSPLLIGTVFLVISLAILKNVFDQIAVWKLIGPSLLLAIFFGLSGYLLVKRYKRGEEEYIIVENIFKHLQVLSASYVAFSHGSNDVANAIGPLATLLTYAAGREIEAVVIIPTWLLFFGGIGIAFGILTWGYKVMETIGKRITEITASRGFAAEFGGASTVLLASQLGIPISTTHTIVGSVIGVGFARGINALNLRVIRHIIISWLITVPFAAVTAILLFLLMLKII